MSLPVLGLLLASVLASAATGCAKTNDVPRLQDEIQATSTSYQERVDELIQRAQAIVPKFTAVAREVPDTMVAQRSLLHARSSIERSRATLRGVTQKAPKTSTAEELNVIITVMREDLEAQLRETTAELSAVESWVAVAEQRKPAPGASASGTVPAGEPSNGAPEK